MSITVTNGSSGVVKVAISTWSKDGNDDFWPLDPGKGDTWGRKDSRGYLMSVQNKATTSEYYVSLNSLIVIEDNLVKNRGQTLSPLASAGQRNVANA